MSVPPRPRALVVDAGLGNLRSVQKALERVGADASISGRVEDVRAAPMLVFPGQGAFGDCARALASGLGDALRERIAAGAPYLGICLGLQVLFEESEEASGAVGLGVFAGSVRRFAAGARDPATGVPLKIPHMGWNAVEGRGDHPVREALEGRHFYFAHSFHAVPSDPSLVAGTCDHGGPFVAAIARDHVVAVQFHPEKSQVAGLSLLEWFVDRGRRWS